MRGNGALAPSGALSVKVIPGDFGSPSMHKLSLGEIVRLGTPQRGLDVEVNRWRWANRWNVLRGYRTVRSAIRGRYKGPTAIGSLYLAHVSPEFGRRELGLASCRVVTDAWVQLVVDRLVASGNLNAHNFHGIGTGGTAEAAGDTDLVTEITTEYATNNVRPSGTQVEGGAANIYRAVGTVTVDAAVAATEHGVFDSATVGAGILLDRSLFAVVNLANGDSLQATFELTLNSGG
jgi:hypothetical protein